MMLHSHIYGKFSSSLFPFAFFCKKIVLESESNKFVSLFFILAEISKFMSLDVPEDYNFSLGLQEGVMDLFDFV